MKQGVQTLAEITAYIEGTPLCLHHQWPSSYNIPHLLIMLICIRHTLCICYS